MNKYILFLTLFLATPLFAQDKTAVKQEAVSSWEKQNGDKSYIALVNEYDVNVNEDYSYDEIYHARVKVQQKDALDLCEWPVYYNKSREQILDIKAYIETSDGKKNNATSITDNEVYIDAPAFADMRVKMIKFPALNVGDIIDVTIKTKTLTKEMLESFWHTVALPVIPTKYARYLYSFPISMPVKFNSYHSDIKPTVKEKNGRTEYVFTMENTTYQDDEDYMPPLDEVLGVLSFSTIKDWGEVAIWYRESINKAMVDDAEISVKALELTKDKQTAKDKALSILEYLQDNFKFVAISPGDHGVALHSTKTIFNNKYGDTKDLALLAKQMLSITGIKANICLFSGEFNGNPQHSLPNPNVFDHLILDVTLDGQMYYIDPQAKGFEIGKLPPSYDNAYLLVIDDQSYHFDQLPISDESFNMVESSSDISVSQDGSAVFDVKVSLPYEASVQFKQQWIGSTPEQQEKFFEQIRSNFTPGGKILDRQVNGIKDRYARVSFTIKYQAPNAYPIVNDMILLKEADQSQLSDLPDMERKSAIFFPTNMLTRNINTYHFPDSFIIDSIPESYELQSDFMQVKVGYTKSEGQVKVDALYRTKRSLIEAKRYEEIKNYHDQLMKKNDQYIVLKKKSNIAPEAKDWIKKQ